MSTKKVLCALFLLLANNHHAIAQMKKQYRLAFVKQVVYQDLYCTNAKNPADIVFSTFRRSGPVALFAALNADFFIVDTEDDPECAIWKEKAVHQKGIAYYESLKNSIPPDGILAGHSHPQGYYAVRSESIDWGKYDIVISMDIAVPARITNKYPHTLWAYYIGEGFEPSFKNSMQKPISGYDAFLTQDYGKWPNHKDHVIEFPYHLHYTGCFHQLLGIENNYQRSGIFLDTHTNHTLSQEQKTQLNQIIPLNEKRTDLESFQSMISRLMQTKYFIIYLKQEKSHNNRLKGRTSLRGNAVPEAIATGNLVIAQKGCLKNTSLLSKKTVVNSFEELLDRIDYFEKNPEEYKKELANQQKNLNRFCYERPMQDLYAHCDRKQAQQHG